MWMNYIGPGLKNKYIENILINRILPFVSKPARYVGNELNAVIKDPGKVKVRFALAFPEIYEIGMSYTGFEILYHILNKHDDIWAERVYMPWKDMQSWLRQEQVPLYSLESFTPLSQFDIVGFTLQYELTFSNVLEMLDLAAIPIYAHDRSDTFPLIIAGGPCSSNPEPMSPFFDAILIGDGEEALPQICQVVSEGRQAGKTRQSILKDLCTIRGVYVPSFYEAHYDEQGRLTKTVPCVSPASPVVQTSIVSELRPEYYPEKPLVPLIEVTHDRLALEVMRGCSAGCRFCSAGMIYRPVREREPEDIVRQSQRALENSGFDEVSFLSLSISDYSRLGTLMTAEKQALQGKYVNVSLPSMRLDSFSEEIARFVATVRKSGFTFAPEAGSERLRRVINKNISDQDLFASVEAALRNGWRLLKFYFMIGLPTETEEDVAAIADLMEEVVALGKKYGRINFHVAISPFAPKAHTPFQWDRQDTRENLLKKVDLLKKRLGRLKNIKLNWRNPDVSALECILGRGDRRLAEVIYQAWKQGALFDGWDEWFDFSLWHKVLKDHHQDFDALLGEISVDDCLPWDHIDKGVTRSFLLKERQKAYRQQSTKNCKEGYCFACGIQRKEGFRDLATCYLKENRDKTASSPDEPESPSTAQQQYQSPTEETESQHYRLRYGKNGYARYISHLDLIRAIERACRRAGILLRYSQGFNPHPKLSFAPPLTLGYSSEAEYVDMELASGYDKDLPEALNAHMPAGIRFHQAKKIEPLAQSLNAMIRFMEYQLTIPNGDEKDLEGIRKGFEHLLTQKEIMVERFNKGRTKTINIRPYIESIDFQNQNILIKTKYVDQSTVRIQEIIDELKKVQGANGLLFQVHRKKQLVDSNERELTPFDLV